MADNGTAAPSRYVRALFLTVIVGATAAIVVSSVAVWLAASRGLDLTDEGIYLVTYRAFRIPDLTFTGAPAILGPLFRALGWSIPALRKAKLIAFVISSGALGFVVERFVSGRVARRSLPQRPTMIGFVLLTVVGGMSVYSFLPQTPSYNDLAVLLTMAAVAITLRGIDRGVSIANVAALAFVGTLLLFVKFPSAVLVGAACVGALALRRRGGVLPLLRSLFVGGSLGLTAGLALMQLFGGNVGERARALQRSNATSVKGQELSQAYGRVYLDGLGSVAHAVLPIALALSAVALAAWFVLRRWPAALTAVLAVSSGAVLVFAWRRGLLTGGADNVAVLQSAFPLLSIGAFVVVLTARLASEAAPAISRTSEADRDLLVAIVLVIAAPTLQGLGSGNSPFVIAAAAGALWVAGVLAAIVWLVPRRGVLSLAGLLGAGLVSLGSFAIGAPALWLRPFRVAGDLRDQTAVVRGVPRLAGVHLDPATAAFISNVYRELDRRGLIGRPGFSSFAGVGLSYALELKHPPAGMYVDEALPKVLRSRIAEACELGIIGPDQPPLIITETGRYPATEDGLRACGVGFPVRFEELRFPAPPYLVSAGMVSVSIWIPRSAG